MDNSTQRKVILPMLALGVIEFGAHHLMFGGAHRLGLGIAVEYAAAAVFLLAAFSLSAYSLFMFLQFKKRHDLKVEDALFLLMGLAFGLLLPIATAVCFFKIRHLVQEISNGLNGLR